MILRHGTRILAATACVAIGLAPAHSQSSNPFAGRWDIVVAAANETYPDWMEMIERDGSWQARMQPKGEIGRAHV